MMAMEENATGEEESVEAQVDVVRFARTRLQKLPPKALCDWSRRSTVERLRKESIAQHKHGSFDCIVEYLGKENWNYKKVQVLLKLDSNLDPEILKGLRHERWNENPKALGQQSGVELAKLKDKNTQGDPLPLRRSGEALIPISTSPAFQRFRSEVSDGSRWPGWFVGTTPQV